MTLCGWSKASLEALVPLARAATIVDQDQYMAAAGLKVGIQRLDKTHGDVLALLFLQSRSQRLVLADAVNLPVPFAPN